VAKPGILLTEWSDGWNACSVSNDALTITISGHDPTDIAKRTLEFAKHNGLDHGQIILALASESVLFASIPASDSMDLKSNQALRFALESVLPVDAEGIVADSIDHGRKASAPLAAVATEVARLKPIVDALEQTNCKVQFIVPVSLLAFEQAFAEKLIPLPSVSLWIMQGLIGRPRVEILAVDREGMILHWQVTGLDQESVDRHLLQLDHGSMNVYLIGNENELSQLASGLSHDLISIEMDRHALSRKRARAILSGKQSPWIDLRRDDLAEQDRWRRHRIALTRMAIAIGLLIATLCGTLLWRAHLYQSMADSFEQRQQALFRTSFPGQRIPAAVWGRIKSEHTKAKGIRKTDPKTTVPMTALATLHRVIKSLNPDLPFEVEEIRIENGRLAMEIELSSQQDAGKLAIALALSGFQVEPPATTLVHGDRILASFSASEDKELP